MLGEVDGRGSHPPETHGPVSLQDGNIGVDGCRNQLPEDTHVGNRRKSLGFEILDGRSLGRHAQPAVTDDFTLFRAIANEGRHADEPHVIRLQDAKGQMDGDPGVKCIPRRLQDFDSRERGQGMTRRDHRMSTSDWRSILTHDPPFLLYFSPQAREAKYLSFAADIQ